MAGAQCPSVIGPGLEQRAREARWSNTGLWRRIHSSVIDACSISSSRLCARMPLSSAIGAGVDALVVPVDRLELFDQRNDGAMEVHGLGGELARRARDSLHAHDMVVPRWIVIAATLTCRPPVDYSPYAIRSSVSGCSLRARCAPDDSFRNFLHALLDAASRDRAVGAHEVGLGLGHLPEHRPADLHRLREELASSRRTCRRGRRSARPC